jgi:hypothetical protein
VLQILHSLGVVPVLHIALHVLHAVPANTVIRVGGLVVFVEEDLVVTGFQVPQVPQESAVPQELVDLQIGFFGQVV